MITSTLTLGPEIAQFTEVDGTDDPGFLVRYLDKQNRLASVRAAKTIVLDQLRLRKGQAVLEAGCGPGFDVVEMAQRVGRRGRVIGVDASMAMVTEARGRSNGLNLPVEFEVGDARALPFADATFDACRSERMLLHVPGAEWALAELVRVTKPGGRVVVYDEDWDTFFIDSPYRDLTRAIIRSLGDRLANPWIGRQLPRLFRANGMTDITVTTHTVVFDYEFFELNFATHVAWMQEQGLARRDELARWSQDLYEAHQTGHFFVAQPVFVVAGTKP